MEHELVSLIAGRRGHFQMESGYHSERWFELGSLFNQPEALEPFVADLAHRLSRHGIDAVCGPITGGAKLAALVAGKLGLEYFFTERFVTPGPGLFPVKYRLPESQRTGARGKKVAIIDDAISAGSAVRGTHAELLACEAQPVALGALIVFGDAAARYAAEQGLALESIVQMEFGMWRPAECPLCAAGVPFEPVSDVA